MSPQLVQVMIKRGRAFILCKSGSWLRNEMAFEHGMLFRWNHHEVGVKVWTGDLWINHRCSRSPVLRVTQPLFYLSLTMTF